MSATSKGIKKYYIVFNKNTDKEGYYTVVEATWQGDAEIYAQTFWPSTSYKIYSSGGFWAYKQNRQFRMLPKELA